MSSDMVTSDFRFPLKIVPTEFVYDHSKSFTPRAQISDTEIQYRYTDSDDLNRPPTPNRFIGTKASAIHFEWTEISREVSINAKNVADSTIAAQLKIQAFAVTAAAGELVVEVRTAHITPGKTKIRFRKTRTDTYSVNSVRAFEFVTSCWESVLRNFSVTLGHKETQFEHIRTAVDSPFFYPLNKTNETYLSSNDQMMRRKGIMHLHRTTTRLWETIVNTIDPGASVPMTLSNGGPEGAIGPDLTTNSILRQMVETTDSITSDRNLIKKNHQAAVYPKISMFDIGTIQMDVGYKITPLDNFARQKHFS